MMILANSSASVRDGISHLDFSCGLSASRRVCGPVDRGPGPPSPLLRRASSMRKRKVPPSPRRPNRHAHAHMPPGRVERADRAQRAILDFWFDTALTQLRARARTSTTWQQSALPYQGSARRRPKMQSASMMRARRAKTLQEMTIPLTVRERQ